jgi:hypothetical protein
MDRQTALERIAQRTLGYDFSTPIVNGCHCVTTSLGGQPGGYPTITDGDHQRNVSHVIWEEATGTKLLPGQQVLHHCDNPTCIEFRHFFLGDDALNMADKVAKGRHARRDTHGRAKLTGVQAAAIRADPRSSNAVGAEYGVSGSIVRRIRRNELWR